MKIQIKINKNTLSGVQIGDLLQDLNELTEKDLRKLKVNTLLELLTTLNK